MVFNEFHEVSVTIQGERYGLTGVSTALADWFMKIVKVGERSDTGPVRSIYYSPVSRTNPNLRPVFAKVVWYRASIHLR